MQPIATDGVAWSVTVSRSVCLSRLWALKKWLNRSRCSLELWLWWPKEPCVGVQIPTCEAAILRVQWCRPSTYRDMSGGRYTQIGVEPVRCGCHLGCTRWDHIGATWQIRLNRPCTAAMRPYIKLLWPVLLLLYHSAWSRIWVFLQYFAKISWYHWSGRTKGISDSTVMIRITYCTCSRLQ